MKPRLVTTIAELRSASAELLDLAGDSARSGAGASVRPTLALVPTMGALHAGHARLVRRAREVADVVVVSVFVNPLQFGDPADLERYPRTLDADREVLAEAGADLVFAPTAAEMYPEGEPLVRLSAGPMAERFEGASRPGHFDGMLTVVAKLLHAAQPSAAAEFTALFGEKDAQQLAIIRRMVADLNMPVRIEGVPIVRDADGVALSSRNRFLSAEEREQALEISRTLADLRRQHDDGGPLRLAAARERLGAAEGIGLDYLELVDGRTFEPVRGEGNAPGAGSAEGAVSTDFAGDGGDTVVAEDAVRARPGDVVIAAAKVGSVRLLDNLHL
ncbi:pantoate--beta-alanine ligase [Arthrobacter sp. UM1]|uniref:pantoate--beta-alanine ligase n=1 Tax=Arthrobacter sp. UM1 TaxID=2766776 RepID=UPI001CF66737|nr:pantoate--beta-alanine ligase [Arthrobacter sp. UM1]MCB4208894.1 pantoate--beta-alanine ligase [Arthrobacter sp. UM1]